jgi:hypothetical protein
VTPSKGNGRAARNISVASKSRQQRDASNNTRNTKDASNSGDANKSKDACKRGDVSNSCERPATAGTTAPADTTVESIPDMPETNSKEICNRNQKPSIEASNNRNTSNRRNSMQSVPTERASQLTFQSLSLSLFSVHLRKQNNSFTDTVLMSLLLLASLPFLASHLCKCPCSFCRGRDVAVISAVFLLPLQLPTLLQLPQLSAVATAAGLAAAEPRGKQQR